MSTEVDSGTLTADGTKQSLSSPATAGVYRVVVDLSSMAAIDAVTLSAQQEVLSGGTVRDVIDVDFTDAQVDPDKIVYSAYLVAPEGCEFFLEQTAGTNRAYPHWIDKLSDVTVVSSGTLGLDGTKQTLSTVTVNDEYVLLTDHALQIGGDTVILRLESPVLDGGTARIIDQLTLTGAQATPNILQQSNPVPSPHSLAVSMEKTVGVNHNVPWALCRLD